MSNEKDYTQDRPLITKKIDDLDITETFVEANARRIARGLSSLSWTSTTPALEVKIIIQHMNDLRLATNTLVKYGASPDFTFTNPTLTNANSILALHLEEARQVIDDSRNNTRCGILCVASCRAACNVACSAACAGGLCGSACSGVCTGANCSGTCGNCSGSCWGGVTAWVCFGGRCDGVNCVNSCGGVCASGCSTRVCGNSCSATCGATICQTGCGTECSVNCYASCNQSCSSSCANSSRFGTDPGSL